MRAVRFQGKPDPLHYILFLFESRCVLIGYKLVKEHKIVIGNKSSFLCAITTNGPAIWGGCVTRHSIRAGSWYFSQKVVTVQGGYGTCFCRHGTNFIEHYACRGTILNGAGKLSPYRMFVRALAQCRVTSCLGAKKLSRCRI
jgi:hypothetical protein